MQTSSGPPPRPEDFRTGPFSVLVPLRDLLDRPEAETVLRKHFAAMLDGPFARIAAELSLLQIATFAVGLIPPHELQTIAAELATAACAESATTDR